MQKTLFIFLLLLLTFSFNTFANAATRAVSGEYIVKYKNENPNRKFSGSLKMKRRLGRKMAHVKAETEADHAALLADPDVEFVEPNYILSEEPVEMSGVMSAPEFTGEYQQSSSDVKVTESWRLQKPADQGEKVIVAIIDSGLAKTHPVFVNSGAIWENAAEKNGRPGVDDDGNGFIDDINGWNFANDNSDLNDSESHGTHVAGIVLGVGLDITEMPVASSKIKIMPLKFLGNTGEGTTSDAIDAIYYAIKNGAKIINNSWGGPSYSQALYEAYADAYKQGVLILSAAGNAGQNNDSVAMYPANYNTPSNFSIMATKDDDTKAWYSNYGLKTVAVAAPGTGILSTVPGSGCGSTGCFQIMSGTSMATPFAAGLAALVLREAPQLSSYQVKELMMNTADEVASLKGKSVSGKRLNALAAVEEAQRETGVAPLSPSFSSGAAGKAAAVSGGGAAGCGLVKNAKSDKRGDFMSSILLMLPFVALVFLRRTPVAVTSGSARSNGSAVRGGRFRGG